MNAKNRNFTIYHFQPESSIWGYISENLNTPDKKTTLEKRGSSFQFREIEVDSKKSVVLGRLCKVRKVNKPTVGDTDDFTEKELEKDVIESCHFLYGYKPNKVLIQKNDAVSTTPNRIMSELLGRIHSEYILIDSIVEDNIVSEIFNQGKIKKIKVVLTPHGIRNMAKNNEADLNFSKDFMGNSPYRYLTLVYHMEPGTVKIKIIERFVQYFNKGKVEEVAFSREGGGPAIKLSSYNKHISISVDLTKEGYVKTVDIYQKLREIYENLPQPKGAVD